MNITIKEGKPLTELARILNRSTETIIENILNAAVELYIFVDPLEDAGHSVADLFTSTEMKSDELTCGFIFGGHTIEIVEQFAKLLFWGLEDCPNCGCETEPSNTNTMVRFDHDSQPYVKGHEYKICTSCSYKF